MHTFNLTACDDMMARASAQESDAVAVEWVMNVSDVMEAQVRGWGVRGKSRRCKGGEGR
jgi:hypothetical protein